MFTHSIPNGRRRTLDRKKKQLFCDTVARGATMTEAAVALGVSLRTVQREARRDADFDRELRSAHHAAADLQTLMQSHARRHWRATAWLLERERPEEYGRRPANSCSPFAFEQGLRTVLEAALAATPAGDRGVVFERVNAACERAFQDAFPMYGPLGAQRRRAPADTPLADAEHLNHIRSGHGPHLPDEVEPVSLKMLGSLGAGPLPSPQPAAAPHHAERLDEQTAPVGWVDRPRQPIAVPPDTAGFPLRDEPLLQARSEGAVHPPSPLQAHGPHHVEQLDQQPLKVGASTHPTADFTPRLSHRYPLRTAATLNQLDPASTPATLTEQFLSLLSCPPQSATNPTRHEAPKSRTPIRRRRNE